MDELEGGRSAIVVPFPLPGPLEAIRLEHVDNARLGVPAHVTLLFPFVPAAELTVEDIEQAAEVVRRTTRFDVTFSDVRTFDPGPTAEGAAWLAPEPPAPFIAMTNALAAAFPGYLPYGGIHDTEIPHLTLANARVDLSTLPGQAQRHLPFTRHAEAAALLIEDAHGRWRIERELSLG